MQNDLDDDIKCTSHHNALSLTCRKFPQNSRPMCSYLIGLCNYSKVIKLVLSKLSIEDRKNRCTLIQIQVSKIIRKRKVLLQ
jgi:hypothetical protein